MATVYTREWIRFFSDAGLPEDVATAYSLIFYENRIQKNMLLDLNKEYLKDMGIRVMGDIIAILRYAKTTHDQCARDKLLGPEMSSQPEESNKSKVLTTNSKRTDSIVTVNKNYTQSNAEEMKKYAENVAVTTQNQSPQVVTRHINVKKRIESPSITSETGQQKLEVPVPKKRRVDPDKEGGYKIKMPVGNTERSKKLLEKAQLMKNKTVFARLGESCKVSSTTSDNGAAKESPLPLVPEQRQKTVSSVFARLAPRASSASEPGLEYAGVLKHNPVKTGKVTRRPETTTNRFMEGVNANKASDMKDDIRVLKIRIGQATEERKNKITASSHTDNPKPTGSRPDEIAGRLSLKITADLNAEDKPLPVTRLSTRFESGDVKGSPQYKNFLVKTTTLLPEERQQTSQHPKVPAKRPRETEFRPHQNNTSDANATAKKVRFASTPHCIIPTDVPSATSAKLKKLPNLRMQIKNKRAATDGAQSKLLSDKQAKVGITERLGWAGFHSKSKKPSLNKKGSIHERLG